MAYSVIWTPDARLEVELVTDYLTKVLGMPGAAQRLLDQLDSLAITLSKYPRAHELSRDSRLAARGYRKAVLGCYVVLYIVDDDAQEVVVTNVVNGSRDYPRSI